jgi:hypothetical protein
MQTKLIITASLILFTATSGFSQKDSSGIYFTANDYVKHKLMSLSTIIVAINAQLLTSKIK